MKKYVSLRIGNVISFLIDKKAFFLTFVFFLAAFFVILVSASVGEVMISPVQVFQTIFGIGDGTNELVIKQFRLPRILISLLVGMCLAVAGGILQNLVRNPLASPDIIGITGGASAAVVLFLMLFSDKNHSLTVSIHWMPLAAFIGAAVTGICVYLLSWKNGVTAIRLVLVGIGISFLTKALTTLLMIKGPIYQASQANIWITGSVYAANWSQVKILFPATIILLLITVVTVRTINIQSFGDEIAIGMGNRVQLTRFFLLFLGTALTAVAVAFGGGIGFVGLIAPHIARKLVGSSFGLMLPISAFVGALIVMLSDLLGKTIFLPHEIPAGVFTSAIGAPYFIYLLMKHRNI
ncbi:MULTISPECIES: FecCD family ABC transporter permease [Aeribacillus]|jgi:iron complex transport system permease protein|uniref:Iron ABC transporter permease n=1 Tax=Aeribacillus pallidus TaxID=33936 RepID=A0A223E518_9BACI|nr:MULTISPECIES: iron ABC transporter permease [Aeribacillus]ASS90326.1 iron ABC transporter permease [Aeribacillus pallidus]MDR9797763.1 iron ABC transporter permease [Aeribacillus pallidus]MED0715325.1 iron ABC transporter permease [Aeribacillus composti]MED0744591.1 iron ABC transporter permease [Aeribacillus composti]MED1437324.1 iron ABC transporter permease [Aeribacillus composti]